MLLASQEWRGMSVVSRRVYVVSLPSVRHVSQPLRSTAVKAKSSRRLDQQTIRFPDHDHPKLSKLLAQTLHAEPVHALLLPRIGAASARVYMQPAAQASGATPSLYSYLYHRAVHHSLSWSDASHSSHARTTTSITHTLPVNTSACTLTARTLASNTRP